MGTEWIERKSKKLEKQEIVSSTCSVPLCALIICIPAEKYRRRYIPRGLKRLPENFIVDYSDEFIASRCC